MAQEQFPIPKPRESGENSTSSSDLQEKDLMDMPTMVIPKTELNPESATEKELQAIDETLNSNEQPLQEATQRIAGVLDPIPEPTLETMQMLHSSANPEFQLEYVERLARLEPHERKQVETYVDKHQEHAWPLTNERLEQMYSLSRADENKSIDAFGEQLRTLTPDQRNQFMQYRNERITLETKKIAKSSLPEAPVGHGQPQTSKFVSMPGGSATATPAEMRLEAQTMSQPNFMKDAPKQKWWQKFWRRKNK